MSDGHILLKEDGGVRVRANTEVCSRLTRVSPDSSVMLHRHHAQSSSSSPPFFQASTIFIPIVSDSPVVSAGVQHIYMFVLRMHVIHVVPQAKEVVVAAISRLLPSLPLQKRMNSRAKVLMLMLMLTPPPRASCCLCTRLLHLQTSA